MQTLEINPTNYLIAACCDGASSVTRLLLDAGADPNSRNDRYTALGRACARGKLFIVRQLLERHANPNLQDASLKTPLHYACSCKYPEEIVDALLEAGADVNIVDADGNYAIHKAIQRGYIGVIQRLLPLYNINLKNGNGETLLCLAMDQRTDIFKLILTSGWNPNIPNNDGQYPLHRAVINEDLEVIELLLNSGIDPLVTDQNGRTPRDLAKMASLNEIANMIELAEGLNVIKEPEIH